ncbi:MAG: flagellar basal body-associated FliL family protein [Planctomycetes bacterium]|nr:flagellar basal body-associated FliL family protein [Planctomycetota bacterium]
MPEDEGQQKQKSEDAGGSSLFNKSGIAFIVVEILTVAFFIVYMQYRDAHKDDKTSTEEKEIQGEDIKYYNKFYHTMEDLNYSIPAPGGNTKTMAMKLIIMLGRTREERQADTIISDVDWKKFVDALNQMDFKIRDKLNQFVRQQSSSQLESQSGQEKIKQMVKEYVNNELKYLRLDLENDKLTHERVTEVLIQDFYVQ